MYLDFLKVSELREAWQIRQAEDAIRLYIDHFLDGNRTIFATVKGRTPAVLDDLKSDAMNRMRETLRIQNYAYRTEKTYLDWVNRYERGAKLPVVLSVEEIERHFLELNGTSGLKRPNWLLAKGKQVDRYKCYVSPNG